MFLNKKDAFYQNKSLWTKAPMVHILPTWNMPEREGETVRVVVYTNCESVELFQDGRSVGKQVVKPVSHAEWNICYKPGRLTAVGVKNGSEVSETIETSGAAEELKAYYNAPIYAMAEEKEILEDAQNNLSGLYGRGYTVHADHFLKDGEILRLAGFEIHVLHTPGHTEGSCCYYVKSEKVLFSGDTLFEGSYGRIDFPTGSGRQMIHSVADILLNLPDDTNVYPGHMGYTTIADEKQYNPLAGYRGREA